MTSQSEFDALCERIRSAGIVAFDTEFVSESFFRPRLCLLQFGVPGEVVGVDPFEVKDLSAWWEIMADDVTTIVVHGSREEVRFCQFATGRPPQKLVDVQIAEGLRSRGFPLSHTNLLSRVLNKSLKHGKETRTDWMRRPLTDSQIHYALDDVRYLLEVWEIQEASLKEAGRLSWAYDEFKRFVDSVPTEDNGEGWRKLPSAGRLNRREAYLAKQLYQWRRNRAEAQDKPQRRLFRDDMLIEVAKRQPKTVTEMNMTRGMNRRDYQQFADEIIQVVNDALEVPDDDLPKKVRPPKYPSQDEVLTRILGLALANRCQQLGLSMALVGTMSDLKDLVRAHVFDINNKEIPKLQRGWRGEVFGQLLVDVLDGKITLRVANPTAENPIAFDFDG